MGYEVHKSDEEWRADLGEARFEVLRRAGTERAYTGSLLDNHDEGLYVCAGCGEALFSSDTKFDSGSGWPSFTVPLDEAAVETTKDTSHGMERIEVRCGRCGGHLGHVFDDGPAPSGQRWCINSAALDFDPRDSTVG